MFKQIVDFPDYFVNDTGTFVLRLCNLNHYTCVGDEVYRIKKSSDKHFNILMPKDKYVCMDGLPYRKLKLLTNQFGYKFVKLTNTSGRSTLYVHRLVYRTFVGVIPSGKEINHIDHNKSNNNIDNLELVTRSENLKKSVLFYGNKLRPRCKCCGKKLGYDAKSVYCLSCRKQKNIKMCNTKLHKYSHPTKEQLWKLIKEKSFVEIGRIYSVTDNAIRKLAKSYGLPFRKRDIERQKEKEKENLLLDSHCIGES